MATIEERRRLLDDKLKEMAEDGVMKRNPKETIAFDPPEEEQEPSAEIQEPKPQPKEQSPEVKPPLQKKTEEAPITLDDYRATYMHPVRIREKTAFTMNVETLQILRNVLQDLGVRLPMAAYIDNILREHLRTHRDLLNNAAAIQRRKTTVSL